MRSLAAVLAALWAGSLCTICGVVAPSLFATFSDRQLAGETAAHFFDVASLIGLGIGCILLILILARRLRLPDRWTSGLIVVTAGLPLVSQLALSPLMSAARAAGNMSRFGMLHGVSAILFVAACVGAVVLVVRVNRAAE
jgi:predicted acyltransferase